MTLQEHTLTLEGSPVFYRARQAEGATVVYLHGVPTSSEDFDELLERTGGIAADLVGFGRSGKGGHLDYTITGLARFVEALIDRLALGPIQLVGHDWGAAVATIVAARRPASVRTLVLIDPAPPLEGGPWHTLARWWRRPVVGELLMGSISKRLLGRSLRRASATPAPWPAARLDAVWHRFDQGTQRATLRLHRSAGPETGADLAHALERLTIPALLLWGERDPWFAPALADSWAKHLRQVTVELVPEAGHWPWLDRPEAAARIAGFLAEHG